MSKAEEKRLRDAADVLHEIHETPDKDVPQELWDKAECVAVIPSVKKAAFIFGGEYGKGVMSCRDGVDRLDGAGVHDAREGQRRLPDRRRSRSTSCCS